MRDASASYSKNLPSLASSLSPRDSSHYPLHSHCRMQGEPRKNKSASLCRTALVRVSTLISKKNLQGGRVIAIGQMGLLRSIVSGGYSQRQVPLGTSQPLDRARTGTGLSGLRLLPIRLAAERRYSPVESKLRPKFLRREKIGKGEAEERRKQSDTPAPRWLSILNSVKAASSQNLSV